MQLPFDSVAPVAGVVVFPQWSFPAQPSRPADLRERVRLKGGDGSDVTVRGSHDREENS